MVRVVLGLLKGGAVGGLLGWGALKLGVTSGLAAFLTYALIGGLVGIVCGRPPWRQDTIWTSTLKGIGGVLVGALFYWGASKLLGGLHVGFAAALGVPGRSVAEIPVLLGPLLGVIWGVFIEVDDGSSAAKQAPAKPAVKPAAKP
jgi:hypothetical protein